MLGCLILGLALCRQLTEVFHRGVWVDLADEANFALALLFILAFALAEQAADDVAEGAQPAFAFQTRLVFHFQFAFPLVLEFS